MCGYRTMRLCAHCFNELSQCQNSTHPLWTVDSAVIHCVLVLRRVNLSAIMNALCSYGVNYSYLGCVMMTMNSVLLIKSHCAWFATFQIGSKRGHDLKELSSLLVTLGSGTAVVICLTQP